ncbi:MAG: RNA polymerase sigma-70 factor (ECF subfamily) [Saprospiraceae bacterium]
MTEQELDLQLVKKVQNGDKNAFNLLVKKYQHKIISLIGRFVRDPMEREDIAQEAFIKAYRALPNFRGDSAFYTWLYRIAVNTAKNHLVSTSRRPPAQDVDVDEAAFSAHSGKMADLNTPEASAMNDELAQAIQTAIDNLPESLKEAIVLREIEGMSYEDIALAMDCPIGTVRSRIFRARETIEEAMESYRY